MSSQKDPDDKNRPSRPQAQDDRHETRGESIPPRNQSGNVVETAAEEDEEWERFEREFDEEWKELSEEERVAELRPLGATIKSVLRQVTGSAVKQPPESASTASRKASEDFAVPEKRNWAKETGKKRDEPGCKGNIPRA